MLSCRQNLVASEFASEQTESQARTADLIQIRTDASLEIDKDNLHITEQTLPASYVFALLSPLI
jgi:hypothetical protein